LKERDSSRVLSTTPFFVGGKLPRYIGAAEEEDVVVYRVGERIPSRMGGEGREA